MTTTPEPVGLAPHLRGPTDEEQGMPETGAETATKLEGGIYARLRASADRRAHLTATVGNRACGHATLSYGELFREVDLIAAGLLDLGVTAGDRIGLVAENSDLWLIADLAILSLGAVDVPRGGDASAAEVQFCVGHAGCTAAIVESVAHLEKLGDLRPDLDFIVVLKGDVPEGALSFEALRRRGEARLASNPGAIGELNRKVNADSLATIIYTSGTTGNPKGVMLTHGNILHNVRIVPSVVELTEGGRYLSFLPSWHSFERVLGYVVVDNGVELHYGSKRTLRDDFPRIRPTLVAGVPRVWETFYSAILKGVSKLPSPLRLLIGGAMEGSRVRAAALRRARRLAVDDEGRVFRSDPVQRFGQELLGIVLLPAHLVADALVYRKLRAAMGRSLIFAISGGGPLPAHVDEFLNRASIPLRNGYGLTESSPVISVRQSQLNRLGTIGRPLPETEVRIVDDGGRILGPCERGVIQARGPQIMQGYYKNEEATRLALPGEGWLDTGDVGMLSDEGDIIITGRAKDTIVLRGGENVEPEPLEAVIAASPLVDHAILVGHGQKTLGALIVPDVAELARELGRPEGTTMAALAADPEAEARLRKEVGRQLSRDRGFRAFEQVGQVAILNEALTVDSGTLTATMKPRRRQIEEQHADLIASMFPD